MEPAADQLVFHLIPHTHWDREWYLTRAAFQARLVPMLDGVVRQLEGDAEARFVLDGQTILLEDYLAIRPEQEARIAALVRRGALEIGPWYVLSDLLVPSADALRRNLEEGARDSARFGRRLDVLYSPDAFGHPAELPSLAAEFGMSRAVIRRGLGRPGGRDRDLYRWEAPGGRRLLAYHLPASGYDIAIDLARAGGDLVAGWAAVRRELVGRAVTDQIAVFLGADHHAMPEDVSGLRRRLQELEPGHVVRVSGLTEFFEAVEARKPEAPALHGELRRSDGHAWVLPGALSARARMKRRHGGVEHLLSRLAAPLAELARREAGTDRAGLLRAAWRTLLGCQFHDTLAGTTSDAVQREQDVRLSAVETLAREIATGSLQELARHDPDAARDDPEAHPPRLVVWNPSARPRSGIMTAELAFFRSDVLIGPPSNRTPRTGHGHRPFVLGTEAGGRVPVQVLAVRWDNRRLDAGRHYPDQDEVDRVWVAFRTPRLAGRETRALFPLPGNEPPADQGMRAESGLLANRFVTLRVSRSGGIALEDRRTGERYAELCELTDEPDQGDLYTFSPGAGRPVRGGRPVSQTVAAQGPLVGAIETRWTMRSAGEGEIGVRQLAVLHADSPIIRIRLDLDHHATGHRLRARFPVGAGEAATAGTAFGTVGREERLPIDRESRIERPATTDPAHRFVTAGHGPRGLAILAPGCFEYEWSGDRSLTVTLLRAVGSLSRNDLVERPGHAAWPEATPEAEEPGRHTIWLGIAPLEKSSEEDSAMLERIWEEFALPIQSMFLGGGPVDR